MDQQGETRVERSAGERSERSSDDGLEKQGVWLTSFFHQTSRNVCISYFFLSFTHTHTHTTQARVRVRPREGGGERKKEVMVPSWPFQTGYASGNSRHSHQSLLLSEVRLIRS